MTIKQKQSLGKINAVHTAARGKELREV